MIVVDDSDFRLYQGDVRKILRALPDQSVDCCVTSPPYWGLRDYGTGQWEGGDPDCDHVAGRGGHLSESAASTRGGANKVAEAQTVPFLNRCGKCGATRVDQQIGLEQTPAAYVAELVAVFREVRRVLADTGTLWLNLGDSYAAGKSGRTDHGTDDPTVGLSGNSHGAVSPGLVVPRSAPPGFKPKDLVGIPWRVAFALQEDGWYLRSDIVWAKPNPMPESVTDRPTKAHEYVFLLSKSPRYFFDQEAVREPAEWARWGDQTVPKYEGTNTKTGWMQPGTKAELQRKASVHRSSIPGGRSLEEQPSGGRNIRSVWEIATQPYPDAHFATFPEELPRRCIAAGCPEQVCRICGKPRPLLVERGESDYSRLKGDRDWRDLAEISVEQGKGVRPGQSENKPTHANHTMTERGTVPSLKARAVTGMVWGDCSCPPPSDSNIEQEVATRTSSGGERSPQAKYRPGIVLDPFMGSGTTALVARKLGRRSIGIELNEEYAALCARRLNQLSLFG